jgi:amidase
MSLASKIRSGALTALDAVDQALDAVRMLDPALHFIDRLDAASAREAARRLVPSGPLAGVPFLVKARTPADAPIITRLVAAGAIPIGTSTRPRVGAVAQSYGWNGSDYTRNPWDQSRSSGGSSAGSAAAVAAGVVPLATGGDSAGSLRIPAAFCGVVGFKGSYGRIPRTGRSLGGLTTAGVIGSDLNDVVTATSIVSGPHRLDPSALPYWPVPGRQEKQWRVSYQPGLAGSFAEPDIDRLLRERLAASQLTVTGVPVDLRPVHRAWETLWSLDNGRDVDGAAITHAAQVRNHNRTVLADLFDEVDALITPTTLTVAHGYDRYEESIVVGALCWAFNVTGHPAVTVPAGLVDGLPVGAQVVAAHGRDDIAVSVAYELQSALPRAPIHGGRSSP